MDESATTQNRRSRRSHLLMAATLELSGRSIAVKLRNLSAEGAQVEGDDLPVEGSDLLFRKGDLATSGRVVWTKDRHAGIRFDQLLQPEAVLNHVPVPRARTSGEFRRPGFAAKALTEQERRLAANWLALNPVIPLGE